MREQTLAAELERALAARKQHAEARELAALLVAAAEPARFDVSDDEVERALASARPRRCHSGAPFRCSSPPRLWSWSVWPSCSCRRRATTCRPAHSRRCNRPSSWSRRFARRRPGLFPTSEVSGFVDGARGRAHMRISSGAGLAAEVVVRENGSVARWQSAGNTIALATSCDHLPGGCAEALDPLTLYTRTLSDDGVTSQRVGDTYRLTIHGARLDEIVVVDAHSYLPRRIEWRQRGRLVSRTRFLALEPQREAPDADTWRLDEHPRAIVGSTAVDGRPVRVARGEARVTGCERPVARHGLRKRARTRQHRRADGRTRDEDRLRAADRLELRDSRAATGSAGPERSREGVPDPGRRGARLLRRRLDGRRGGFSRRSQRRGDQQRRREGRRRPRPAAAQAPRISLIASVDSLVGDSEMTVAGRLEPRERLAQRLGAQRPFAVGQVLRLVAVRELDVGEVDVERRARPRAPRRPCAAPRRTARPSRNAPSEVACMWAKSSTGRTQSSRDAISTTSSTEPSSRTRPITSIPNGTARSFPSSRSRSSPSCSTTESIASSRVRPSRKPGMEDDDLGAGGLGDPGRVVEHPDRHVQLLAALGVAHEAGDRRVHRERDVVLPRELAEALGELVVHPEPSLEVDLARREPAREQRFDRCLGALPRGDARRAEVELTRH